MIYKACPRCLGDLFGEDDAGYPEAVCLQCGFRAALSRRQAAIPAPAPAALPPQLSAAGARESAL